MIRARVRPRRCACGGIVGPTGECAACRAKRLARERSSSVTSGIRDVLRTPGRPLEPHTRRSMEARLGHDFASVRVHDDRQAGASARALSAEAYAFGSHLVFGEGRYVPASPDGHRLLAHELAHVAQSPNTGPLRLYDDPASEREADAAAHAVGSGARAGTLTRAPAGVRRLLKVAKPTDKIPNPTGKGAVKSNADTIRDYLKTLCPTGGVTVDTKSGAVNITGGYCTVPAMNPGMLGPPSPSPAQASATPAGCDCLCGLAGSKHSWTIMVDDSKWPHTDFDDEDAANGVTAGGTGGTVTAPSPNSPKIWGAESEAGKAVDVDPWLVLGHELCGHGWLGDQGLHGPDVAKLRGEGGHQETVARERLIETEHKLPLRGGFKDPYCGESYFRTTPGGAPTWSDALKRCQAWRDAYNKANKTSYTIKDRIP